MLTVIVSRVCFTGGGGLVGSSLQAVKNKIKEQRVKINKNFRIFIGTPPVGY